MIGWEDFVEWCRTAPVCRVQGKRTEATRGAGRLVRYNRAVRVLVHTAEGEGARRRVHAVRVRWDWRRRVWVDLDERMVLQWHELDWVTWKAAGDPNFTWLKVA